MGSQPRHALPMTGMTTREHNKPALALHTHYMTRQLLLCTRVVLWRTCVTQHASPCFAHAWCCAAHSQFEALWWAESEDGYCVAVLHVDVPCSVHSTCCCARATLRTRTARTAGMTPPEPLEPDTDSPGPCFDAGPSNGGGNVMPTKSESEGRGGCRGVVGRQGMINMLRP